jgi:putative transposase
MKYIDRNPVRAGLVKSPEQYPWSSYNFHVSPEPSSTLSHHSLYLDLGKDIEDCRFQYKKFVIEQPEDDCLLKLIRERTNNGSVIGTDEYVNELESKTELEWAIRKAGRKKSVSDTN